MKQSQLEILKSMTTVVADTGDFQSILQFRPQDATTNPTLILQASKMEAYKHLIETAKKDSEKEHSQEKRDELLLDLLLVNFGVEILKIVPGRVSTEVDAALSFDTIKSIEKARCLIQLYEERGISRERVLIKLASTWEGIEAAKVLEKEGIHCNMTLIFSLVQAIACADANTTLVSPFVGRVLDWYMKKDPSKKLLPQEEPGVLLVQNIYMYFKKFGYKTQVMGASFRNKGEIIALAGCDLLTIAPKLLHELETSEESFEKILTFEKAKNCSLTKTTLDESTFRYLFNKDSMAVEKLADGIRVFDEDLKSLLTYIKTT